METTLAPNFDVGDIVTVQPYSDPHARLSACIVCFSFDRSHAVIRYATGHIEEFPVNKLQRAAFWQIMVYYKCVEKWSKMLSEVKA